MIRISKWPLLLNAGISSLVLLYLYIPIGLLVVNSFNQSRYGIEWQGFTWEWYGKLFENTGLLEAARHSLLIAILAATIATVIGTLAAIALYRYRFAGKNALSTMLFFLLVSPDIVLAIAFLSAFLMLGIALGFWSLLIAHVSFCMPFVVVTVLARLRGFPSSLIEAAQDLGASDYEIVRKILLPMMVPALLAGWLLSFTLSLDDVVVSAFVTGPDFEILPVKVYSMVRVGVSPEVNVIATLLLFVSLLIVLLSQWLARRYQN
jgi:spermidine/putrescine transport system permease protein